MTWDSYYTLYHGKCLGFEIHDAFPIRAVAKFDIDPVQLAEEPLTMFLMRDKTEMLSLTFAIFYPKIEHADVKQSTMVTLSAKVYIYPT